MIPDLEHCLRAAAKLAAENASAFAALGDFYCSGEDYHAALSAYDEAVRLAPADTRHRYNRAVIQRFLGDWSPRVGIYIL